MIFETTDPTSPFNWLKKLDSGIASLGIFGNFYAKMPNVMQDALILDIETSGIGKHHTIFEVAIKDLANGRVIEYNLAPVRVAKEESRKVAKYINSMDELMELAQPWSRERIQKGQFAYLKEYFRAIEDSPALINQIKAAGSITIGEKTYLSPGTFFEKFSQDIKGSKALYVANLNFENTNLGALAQTLPEEKLLALKQQFYSYTPGGSRFLYRTANIHRQIQSAYQKRTMAAWADVGQAYRRGFSAVGGIRTGDILDVARASMAESTLAGFTKTKDVFTGMGIETQSQALGLAKKELHTAAADVALEGNVLSRQLTAGERLATLRSGSGAGFLAGVHSLVTGKGVLSDIQALQRIESLQPLLKKEHLSQQLAHLELAVRGENVDAFIIRDKLRSRDIRNKVRTVSGFRDEFLNLNFRTGPDVRNFQDKSQAVQRWLRHAPKAYGLDNYPNLNLEQIYKGMQETTTADLWKLYEPKATIEYAEAAARRNLAVMNKAKVASRLEMASYLFKNYRKASVISLGAMFVLGANIFNRISANDDDYNTLTGMQEGGFAAMMRHDLTEFGSGWIGRTGKAIGRMFSRITGRSRALPGVALFGEKSLKELSTAVAPNASYRVAGRALPTSFAANIKSSRPAVQRFAGMGETLKKQNIGAIGYAAVNRSDLAKTYKTAAHEYGHVVTLQESGQMMELTSESQAVYRKMMASKKYGQSLSGLESRIQRTMYSNKITRSMLEERGTIVVKKELFAEAVSAYKQSLSVGKDQIGFTHSYMGKDIGRTDVSTMIRLGKHLEKSSIIARKLRKIPSIDDASRTIEILRAQGVNRIPGADDAYNTIEALRSQGAAEASRRSVDVPFGSGWHRDVTWSLPYIMSLSRDRLGPEYSTMAIIRSRDLVRTHFVPPGAWGAGASTNSYLSTMPMITSNTTGQHNSQWGMQGIGRPLAGLQDRGQAGQWRNWRSGFGSGWMGASASDSASEDFVGARQPVIPADYSDNLRYYNTKGYDWPQVIVPIQTESSSRPLVDENLTSLTEITMSRRVKDYQRKQGMASAQIATGMKAFHDSKYGAKGHLIK